MMRARTSGVTASRCIPSASIPASFIRVNHFASPGGSHCPCSGRFTAALMARALSTRMRAPRSLPDGVPVVITMCFTPSSSTAALATSASCSGVFRAMVRPAASDWPMAQNWQAFARFS